MPIKTGKEGQRPENQRWGGSLTDSVSQLLRSGALAGGILAAWRKFVQLPAWDSLVLAGVLRLVLAAALVIHHFSVRLAGRLPWIFALLGGMTAIFGGLGQLLEGVIGTVNMGIAYWNLKEEDAIPYLMQGAASRSGFFLLGLVMVFCVTGLCWYIARKGAIASSLLLTLLALVPGIMLKQLSFWGLILLFLGLIGQWLHVVGAGSMRMRLAWTLVSASLFLGIVGVAGTKEVGSILQFKNKTLQFVDEARFGKDMLPEGDLRKAYSMKQGDAVTLRVTSGREKALYLRGYTAGDYEDGHWVPLKRSAYSGGRNGFLKWLENQGFDPNTEYALSRKVGAASDGTQQPEAATIRIQNLGASRKYYYTLYSAEKPAGSYGIAANRDEGYRSHALSGVKTYEICDFSQNIPGELNKLENWMYAPQTKEESNYLQAEAVYRDFVYDAYMEVDAEFAPLIETIFHDPGENETDTEESIYTVTQKIREKMEQNMVYSPNPEQPEDGGDPLRPFLRGEQVGNAAFFASAGVMAYRSFGIPARYAEGYLKERTNGADGAKTVNLTGHNGHAWVEVYMDGLGWVPIDVTPGYYYNTYALLQMIGLPDEIQKASVTEDQGKNMDNALELQGAQKHSQKETVEKILISMAVSGAVLLMAFLLFLFIASGEFRMLYEDWKIERLLGKSQTEDTAGEFGGWITKELARIGIEMRVGWRCAETEQEILAYLPGVAAGEYVRVNELLEKWFYGGEPLEPEEIRVLYTFLRKIKTVIDRRHRYDWINTRVRHLIRRTKRKNHRKAS